MTRRKNPIAQVKTNSFMSYIQKSTAVLVLFCIFTIFITEGRASVRAADPVPRLRAEQLASLQVIIEKEIRNGNIPGAVVIVGTPEGVVYRRAFGNRSLEPQRLPMTEDTIFDIASLTKAVATTTAIMQLVEKGKIRIDAPVARYWPAFKANGKKEITIRHLLTHHSGLKPDLKLKPKWSGYKTAIKMIIREKPIVKPGSCFIYGDTNFAVLGEIVRRVSGQSLEAYCTKNIFKPLGMKETFFKPSKKWRDRIAPTSYHARKMLQGDVHDPVCYRMGGVAGHAGLFSTADDLALFARMLLNGGSLNNVRILKPETVEAMTIPQAPPEPKAVRGFGWDLEPPFAANRDSLPSAGSYAHLGYTGTALWIDPVTRTYIILLTNRVHPDGKGDIKTLRAQVRQAVGDALGPLTIEQILARRPSLAAFYAKVKQPPVQVGMRGSTVMTGIDVLDEANFSILSGLRVGLITNHTGLDATGRRTLDLLYRAPGVKLKALFSPEHGLGGDVDEKVASTRESRTGLPVYSLYGASLRPDDKMLKDLDALVFDIQDAGVRFYTYISTMGYAMEAAAKKGIKFFVLDRPNPINAALVQGPVMDRDLKSFTGYFPLPIRHGMTVGELAEMFNSEYNIGAQLQVIKMRGYKRTAWFDETGLAWVNPSPNLRSLTQAILYPGVALVEGSNVSVGRGTDAPFELLGAPWIDGEQLAAYLNSRAIQGVRFTPAEFTPVSHIYKQKKCRGVRIALDNRQFLDTAALGIEIVSALYHLYPRDFQVDKTLGLIGSRSVVQAIKDGLDPQSIVLMWQNPLAEFLTVRSKYLLY